MKIRFFSLSSYHPLLMTLLSDINILKQQLDDLRPFDTSQLLNLRQWFRIGFVHHSNAIEWNTLTLSEVKLVLEDGMTVWWKTIRELKETINHGTILDTLHDLFAWDSEDITLQRILDLHKALMQWLLPEWEAWQIRTKKVRVSGSEDVFPLPQEVQSTIQKYIQQTKNIHSLSDVAHIHYDFVKIHPFMDGNGRIARVLMNIGIVKLWYLPIIIPKIVRQQYIESLQWEDFQKRYEFFLWQTKENMKDYVRFLGK